MLEEENKVTNTYETQKSESERISKSGEANPEYLNLDNIDPALIEKKIKEQLLANPVIKAEYHKAYYRTAELTYTCKVKKRVFDLQKLKVYIYQAIIWVLLITETILASVGPKYFSWGTLFDIFYIGLSIYILITIIKTKYHSTGNYLLNRTVMRVEENPYGLVKILSKFNVIYWISCLWLIAGTIVDITNIGINVHVVKLPIVFIQVALVAILFIIYTLYCYAVKDLYGLFTIVIGHGEIRETLPDKDTVYDFDGDSCFSCKDFFNIHKDIKEDHKGV